MNNYSDYTIEAVFDAVRKWNKLYRVLPSREFWYGERAKKARENLSNAIMNYDAAQHCVEPTGATGAAPKPE